MRIKFLQPLRNQKGVVLIWMAMFMLAMLAFVALSIDGAKMMATRSELQNAADGAALAGASAINFTTGNLIVATGRARAQEVASSNKAFIGNESAVNVADADVIFLPSEANATDCKVITRREGDSQISIYIEQILNVWPGGPPVVANHPIRATATAHLAQPNCVSDVVPIGLGFNAAPLVTGKEYDLISGIAPGNYQYLDLPECSEGTCGNNSGANKLGCQIDHGYGCCVIQGHTYNVQTGVATGPVKSAIDARFARDSIKTEYTALQLNSYQTYRNLGGNDARVIHVPLCTFTLNPGNTNSATVNGFAAFFLKTKFTPGQKIYKGEFIKAVVQGEGDGGTGTVYTVKLIK
jgi:Putative Flp pilus-assembly TadE/G-like